VKIKNLRTSGPILMPLTTGNTLRLSPGQASKELPDIEVADNAKVDKLRRQGVIDVETTQGASNPTPGASGHAATESAKSRK
jgi:hypothetical protein